MSSKEPSLGITNTLHLCATVVHQACRILLPLGWHEIYPEWEFDKYIIFLLSLFVIVLPGHLKFIHRRAPDFCKVEESLVHTSMRV